MHGGTHQKTLCPCIFLTVLLFLHSLTANGAPADLLPRQGTVFPRPAADEALLGTENHTRVSAEETLADLALRHALGYRELTLANSDVDPWLPEDGTRITLPQSHLLPDAPRHGIVLNLAEMRLYYFPEDDPDSLWSFPVGIGRQGWQTPTATTEVVRKARDPAWYPPASIQAEREALGQSPLPDRVPPGPDNPLGRHALYLGLPAYLLHGTNQPYGIGMPVSHGCIRLHPDDIRALFHAVPDGTPVNIVSQPVKAGWHEGTLYLEVHPPLSEDSAETGNAPSSMLVEAIIRATDSEKQYDIDWEHAHRLIRSPDGRPHPIGTAVEPSSAQ